VLHRPVEIATQSRLFSIISNIENLYNKLMDKYWVYVLCAAGLNFFSGQIVITSHLAFSS